MAITEDDVRRIVREELKALLRPAVRTELGMRPAASRTPGPEKPVDWVQTEHERHGRRVERIRSPDGKSIIETRIRR